MTGLTGIQGGPGSFNDVAFRTHVNGAGRQSVRYFDATEPLLEALRAGTVDLAQFALESHRRLVAESVEAVGRHLLTGAGLHLARRYSTPTPYGLLALPGTQVVRRIIAHPVALADCRRTLAERYGNAVLEEGAGQPDPTGAAERLAAGQLTSGTAVLGCAALTGGNGLEVIEADLSDDGPGSTTFVLVSLSSAR